MKILVFPNEIKGNPYFKTFRHGFRAAGIEDVRLSSVLRLGTNFDAIHLHHPEHAVTQLSWLKSAILSAALLSVALYARLTGRPVVWMVHDVEPAWVRRKAFLTTFMRAIKKLTTAHVFLNKSSQQIFYEKNPQEAHKPFCFAPHSRFDTSIFDAASVREHRAINGVAETDLLVSFLGSITTHKGLECAALVPDKTKAGQNVKIAVCGMIDAALPRNYVDNILRHKPRQTYIRVADRLTDEELALWIQSSDAVVLPYRSGSNSGMALNVLSNHGRIISSELPMFKELAQGCGPSWIRCVDVGSAAAVSEIVDGLQSWKRQEPDDDRLERILAEGDPVENGRRLRDFYHRLQSRQLASPVG
jgi:glycosyltransferase involved in cell wall biosynthesis